MVKPEAITATPRVIEIKTEEELKTALAGAAGPVALEFTQKDCEFCDEEKPKVEKLAAKCGNLTVLRVDVDDLPDLADAYLGEEGGTPTLFYAKTSAELQPGKATELEDSTELRRKIKCARTPRK